MSTSLTPGFSSLPLTVGTMKPSTWLTSVFRDRLGVETLELGRQNGPTRSQRSREFPPIIGESL